MMSKALGSINLTAWGDVLLYFKSKQQLNYITKCNLEIETKDQAIENEIQVVLDDEGEPMLWVEEAKTAQDKLERAVSQLGSKWIVDDLATALELTYSGANKILQVWLVQGIAELARSGAKGRPARYRFARSQTKR